MTACVIAALAGCVTPVPNPDAPQSLRRSIVESTRRELAESTSRPQPVRTTTELVPTPEEQEQIDRLERFMDELDQIAGPKSIDASPSGLPEMYDLYGNAIEVSPISLEEAIRLVVSNNLELRFARLSPGVTAAQVTAAEAAFDWTFFSSVQWQSLDQPVTSRSATGFNVGGQFRKSDNLNTQIGVRRLLASGAELTLDQQLNFLQQRESGLELSPNPAWDLVWNLQVDQPLLRGFGSDVNLAQVRIARNANRDSIAQFRADMIRVVLQTEQAYWDLFTAHRDVLILAKLLAQGEDTSKQVKGRAGIDATGAQIGSAEATVAERRANLQQAIGALRQRSDALKRLINDPTIPLTNETLLLPNQTPLREPVRFNLADAVATGLRQRPEIEQAILSIDDSSTRLLVAQNNRLPTLDLRIQLAISALNDDLGAAFRDGFERNFADVIAGLFFEIPVGNRAANAETRQRTLERQQAEISFKNTVQGIILEVKNSLNNIVVNAELVYLREFSRIRAAESLRALRVVNKNLGGFTVERLNTELSQQQQVAAAEQAEIRAQVDYQLAIAEFYAATGTILERNQITIEDPSD